MHPVPRAPPCQNCTSPPCTRSNQTSSSRAAQRSLALAKREAGRLRNLRLTAAHRVKWSYVEGATPTLMPSSR